MLTAGDLSCLDAVKSGDNLGFVVMSTCHLKDLSTFKKADSSVVIAGNLADAVVTQRLLQLEAKNALCIWIFTGFTMKFATGEIELTI